MVCTLIDHRNDDKIFTASKSTDRGERLLIKPNKERIKLHSCKTIYC